MTVKKENLTFFGTVRLGLVKNLRFSTVAWFFVEMVGLETVEYGTVRMKNSDPLIPVDILLKASSVTI